MFTASAFVSPNVSNDIANTIGPFVAVIDVLKNGATITVSVLRVLC